MLVKSVLEQGMMCHDIYSDSEGIMGEYYPGVDLLAILQEDRISRILFLRNVVYTLCEYYSKSIFLRIKLTKEYDIRMFLKDSGLICDIYGLQYD